MIWTDCYKELVEIIRNKDGFLASIPDEYSELRERMENTPEIEHIDMWHEQVSFLVQRLHTQIDFRLFYETFSDTCEGAEMQEEALSFLDLLTLLGMMLHGKSGKNFGTLRRTHVGREESGGAGNMYRISFECEIMDYTTMELASHADMKDREMNISNGGLPEKAEDEEPLYHL